METLKQRRIWGEELSGNAAVILTTPEPLEAEAGVEEEALAHWLYSLGVHVYRVRLSGHCYPYQLKAILSAIKPEKLVPIHTSATNTMLMLFNRQKERSFL